MREFGVRELPIGRCQPGRKGWANLPDFCPVIRLYAAVSGDRNHEPMPVAQIWVETFRRNVSTGGVDERMIIYGLGG
jgi:hypothetical protein